ncbi:MAG: tetraacyldisaccharide 4'-kinase [Candidatus Neomarinimicrobiota bacterium]
MSSPAIKLFTHPLRYLLFPLALFYWGVIFWRNLFYTIGFFVTHRLPCRVVSIGNLSLGGTGKTPAVIYLAQLLLQHGRRVAILSRGYGRSTSGTRLVTDGQTVETDWRLVGDEPCLMARQLHGIPIVVDENRYRGGVYLFQNYDPDIILLDDAFQHRNLERDVDVVLMNALDTVADHKLFPYGRLREPWFHLRRADIIFWTKTNLASPPVLLKGRLNRLAVPNFTSRIIINPKLTGLNSDLSLEDLNQKPVLAVSAVGDPAGFGKTLRQACVNVIEQVSYTDHFNYRDADLHDLRRKLEQLGAEYIVTTEKDLLKFAVLKTAQNLPIYAIGIQFSPSPGGEQALLRLILNGATSLNTV